MAKRIDFHSSLCEPFRIFMRNHEPMNLSLKAQPPANKAPAPTLLLSGRGLDGEELWSILYASDHLFVSGMGGNAPFDLGPSYETFGLSYNPITGSLAVTCGRKVQTFHVRCSWAQPDMVKANWRLWIGRPLDAWQGFDNASMAPVGWKFEGNILDGGHTFTVGHFSAATIKDNPMLDVVPADEIRSVLRELGIDDLATDEEEEEEIEMHWEAVLALGLQAAEEIPADGDTISNFASELLEAHLKWAAARRSRS